MDRNPYITIRPTRGWCVLNLANLWKYRDLIYFLTWRDIKVRYKQTVLGAAWAVIQPFLSMVVFSIFFGRFSKISSEGMPYPIFVYSALLPWQLFSQSLNQSGNSLVENQRIITKVYFPRLAVPISAVLGGLLDFCISFVILLGLLFYYEISITPAVLFLPLFALMAVLTALGAGLWLSALNVLYRDVRYTITFLIQIWFFLSPVVYPSSIVPERWRLLYSLNPMTGVIEGFRWALLGTTRYPSYMFIVSALIMLILVISGVFYFRRMERIFADVI